MKRNLGAEKSSVIFRFKTFIESGAGKDWGAGFVGTQEVLGLVLLNERCYPNHAAQHSKIKIG